MEMRRYAEADRTATIALAERLQEGVAPWREPQAVKNAVTDWVRGSLDASCDAARAVFVAEDEHGLAGVVTVGERAHFTGDVDGYVGELVVHPRTLRSGVGRALMMAAKGWARRRGHLRLSLDTGAANRAARGFYSSLGYEEEDVRLSKAL